MEELIEEKKDNESFMQWAQEKVADDTWPFLDRMEVSKTLAIKATEKSLEKKQESLNNLEKDKEEKKRKEEEKKKKEEEKKKKEDDKDQDSNKKKIDKQDDDNEDFPVSALNRLTYNLLRMANKYFEYTLKWDKFFEEQWEERGDNFNEAMVDYHKKICKRISMFEDKYNALAVAGLAALVKIPVTPVQKQSG